MPRNSNVLRDAIRALVSPCLGLRLLVPGMADGARRAIIITGVYLCWQDASMSDVTQVLSRIEQGDLPATHELLPLVYEELRRLASQRMAQETPGQTLQATALVHEAYVRLVDTEKVQHWDSRGHFFAAAAEAMRRILVEQARRKRGPQAGGRYQRIELSDVDPGTPGPQLDILVLNEALQKLLSLIHI